MRMPFGKHKGKKLRELPTGYLLWVLHPKQAWISSYVREKLWAELKDRIGDATIVREDIDA